MSVNKSENKSGKKFKRQMIVCIVLSGIFLLAPIFLFIGSNSSALFSFLSADSYVIVGTIFKWIFWIILSIPFIILIYSIAHNIINFVRNLSLRKKFRTLYTKWVTIASLINFGLFLLSLGIIGYNISIIVNTLGHNLGAVGFAILIFLLMSYVIVIILIAAHVIITLCCTKKMCQLAQFKNKNLSC